MTTTGYRVSTWSEKMFSNLTEVMAAQLSEYRNHHPTYTLNKCLYYILKNKTEEVVSKSLWTAQI